MSVQPFIQITAGRPKVEVGFRKVNNHLQCEIYNLPVRNTLLVKIGITRDPINDLSVRYYITEASHTNKTTVAVTNTPELDYFGRVSQHISLPASLYEGAKFNIGTKVKVYEDYFKKPKIRQLADGYYTLHLNITYDGKTLARTKNFIVRTSRKTKYIDWESSSNVL